MVRIGGFAFVLVGELDIVIVQSAYLT